MTELAHPDERSPDLAHLDVAYLDHAATTPLRPEAFDAMRPFLRGLTGNPSGAHSIARAARAAIDDARETVAACVGADASEVVFTSGGTEADNLAVLGVHDRVAGVIVCSAIEHHAVLEPVQRRGGLLAPVRNDGIVDLDALGPLLTEATAADRSGVSLVSVMLVNNEIGTIQPLAAVAGVVRTVSPNALVHTDAVQAAPWLDLTHHASGEVADLVSISAHKFGGPKGTGALVVRDRAVGLLAPRQIGGGQERERRGGTQNVAGIVGLAAALAAAVRDRDATNERVAKLRDRLVDGLLASVPDSVETAGPDRSERVPGLSHLCFHDVESEALLFLLEEAGVCASAGSSCASGAMEPSHVLMAMGVPRTDAFGSVRFSLGFASTERDVDRALAVVPEVVMRLRSHR